MLEFTMVFLPLLAAVCVIVDVSWAIFAKATLQRAVRIGVRTGVTLTAAQMSNGACLTDTVKKIVQANSIGMLQGDSGLSKIKVRYYEPPATDSSTTITDVTTAAGGSQPGNLMFVTVENYSISPLLPRVFGWNKTPDTDATVVTASSADRIEPSRNPPCMGTAP